MASKKNQINLNAFMTNLLWVGVADFSRVFFRSFAEILASLSLVHSREDAVENPGDSPAFADRVRNFGRVACPCKKGQHLFHRGYYKPCVKEFDLLARDAFVKHSGLLL